MADLVLIAEGTYKPGLNNIGDVVSVHDDGRVGGGVGYEGFTVVNVPGTAKEVLDRLNAEVPEQKRCFRTKTDAGVWGDEPPEEAYFWLDGTEWKKIEVRPKYQLNLLVDETLDSALKDKALTDTSKLALVGSAVKANVKELVENQTVTTIVLKEAEATKS